MAEEKKYISSVKLGEDTYQIKDTEARTALDDLLGNVLLLDCGTSTTNIEDVAGVSPQQPSLKKLNMIGQAGIDACPFFQNLK